MTKNDCEKIAEILRQTVVRMHKMTRLADAADARFDAEHFAQTQMLLLATEIGSAFAEQDPTFKELLVEPVRAEVNRGK